jgi:CHASE3 domain sensor protein
VDLEDAEDSKIVRTLCGLALVGLCLTVGFRFAFNHTLNHTLTKVSDSLTGGLEVVEHADGILDDLDRLNINQRAYLATGDERFSEDVVESVIGIRSHLESLEQFGGKGPQFRDRVEELHHKVDWVLNAVGKSNELQQSAGVAVAMALLDDDDSIGDAKLDAIALKKWATEGVFDRVRRERKAHSVLEVLF